MPPREDPWLAEVLGRPVYVVEGDANGAEAPGFYYAKAPVEDVERVASLAATGFTVVDVNVTLAHGGGAAVRANAVAVERARPEHHEALLEIAGSCFRYSRFHLDPQIPDELAHRVKREWIRSYVEERRGVELLAALDGGIPVGFLAVLEREGARAIDLIGVDASKQGRGVGGALVSAFVERHAPAGSELIVGTQIANVPSLRLYARHGFAIRSAAYVLHRHVEAA